MKTNILALGLLAGLSLASNAQTAAPQPSAQTQTQTQRVYKDPAVSAKKHAEQAALRLGLNADQKAKWEAAVLRRMTATQPVHEKLAGATTPAERKDLHRQLAVTKSAFEQDIAGFLTPEQQAAHQQQKAERQKKQHGRRAR